jgi:hypothetical protein
MRVSSGARKPADAITRELIAAGRGSQCRGPCRLVAVAGGIEEVEEAADHPISCCDTKCKRADDGQQEQDRHKKCHHTLLITSDAPGPRPDVSSATPYLCTTLARIDADRC